MGVFDFWRDYERIANGLRQYGGRLPLSWREGWRDGYGRVRESSEGSSKGNSNKAERVDDSVAPVPKLWGYSKRVSLTFFSRAPDEDGLAEFEARYATEREVQDACHSLFVRLADLKMSEVSVKDNTAMELCKKVGLFN